MDPPLSRLCYRVSTCERFTGQDQAYADVSTRPNLTRLRKTDDADSPFYRLLATKYAPELEDTAIALLVAQPELARLEWPGPSQRGGPFVAGATALHYAANDGKDRLVLKLIECGADVNDSNAQWYRSVL